ncbi:hypothetical protein [Staphylococcus simulans]|uniref:hypothetical protein n=1 Tax=Staphylococcus simulans TaxID=1286 RepID=UPI000D1FA105|nr:hypothetical protein [Staphylococcus simulans]PTJ46504.1 hypothetical protein BU014_08980 [Staphylococcus simulans]
MKTKEFIKRVEDMGFKILNASDMFLYIYIREVDDDYQQLGYVDVETENIMNISGLGIDKITSDKREKLFKLIVKYASTPPEERKEEKKYYIKHKYLRKHNAYLNYDKSLQEWTFHTKSNAVNLKTQFTLAELPEWVHETIEDGYLVKEEVE